MKNIMKLAPAFCMTVLLVGSGCASQRILAVQDHQSLPITKVETLKSTNYLFTHNEEHQFWLCKDEGEQMTCDLECGGGNDLVCPQGIVSGGTTTSNIR